MKLYTINATPMQTLEQVRGGGDNIEAGALDAYNGLNMLNYDKAVAEVFSSLDIDGFTMYRVNGYWKGVAEPSFKIEVATDDERKVREACMRLRVTYNQDAVMLTLPDNTVEFI